MSGSGKPFTVQDVARLAGVSAMTVSRALNTPEKLSPDTLKRVQEAVDKLSYVPNAMASGLRLSRARLVAALLPTLVGPVFQEMIESLDRSLNRHGYQLMIGRTGYDAAQEAALLKAVIQRRPDGIIMTGLTVSPEGQQSLRSSRIPVVETWDFTPSPIDMLVGFSHSAIGETVVQYFSDTGHQQVAIISADDTRARARVAAFQQRAQALGLPPVTIYFCDAPSTIGSGRRGMVDIITRAPDVTAVFCSSDTLALGALIEAQHRAIPVPSRLAVIGLGDQEFAKDAPPPLTTVRIDGTRIGELAAELVVARAEGTPIAQPIIDIGFHLVRRSSA